MSDNIGIRHRYKGEDAWRPANTAPLDQLDIVMRVANAHFGDPAREIGGPKMPPAKPKGAAHT